MLKFFTAKYLAAAVFLVSLALGFNFISAAPGDAGPDPLLGKILENRDFFAQYSGNGVSGYGESRLCDVSGLGDGPENEKIGLLLLESSGFLKSVVVSRKSGAKLHEETGITGRTLRNELERAGILVSDVKLIAQNIAGFSKTQEPAHAAKKPIRRKTRQPRRRRMPPKTVLAAKTDSLNENRQAEKPLGSGEALERIRGDVARNPETSAMSADEILSRFRSEIREMKKSK